MKNFNTCPICNKAEFRKTFLKKWRESSFVRCINCGLIFQNPQEDVKKTENRYGEDYFKYEVENQNNFFNLVEKTLNDFNIFNIIPKNSNILEIGSATGLFLKYVNDFGYKSTGLEICRESVEYGIKNYAVNLLNCKLEDAGFIENTFDFIHFSHLIEHLNDPVKFLNIIYKILKINGFALITTPNSLGLFSRIFYENWRCIVDDHLFLFNKYNLAKLLKQINFKIVKYETWGSIPLGKTPKLIKKISDCLVKKTATGDVVCFLVQKIN